MKSKSHSGRCRIHQTRAKGKPVCAGLDLAGERLSGKGLVAEATLRVVADGLLAALEGAEDEHPPENLTGGLRGVWGS